MAKAITGADEESKAAQQSLDRLGLAAADLQGLSPERQFELIGKRIAGIEDSMVRAGIALELFGRSGTMLLPMLGDLSSLRAEARRLGQTISTEDAEAADTFGRRQWTAFGDRSEAVQRQSVGRCAGSYGGNHVRHGVCRFCGKMDWEQ